MGAFGAIYPVIFLNGKPSIITGLLGGGGGGGGGWTKTPSPAGITPLDKVLKKLSANIGWLRSVQFITSFIILDAQVSRIPILLKVAATMVVKR